MAWLATCRAWAKRIKRDAMTLWFARLHPATPWQAKALAVFVAAYALSPIDLIPDFIPVLGYLDDLILLPVLIWLAVRMLPPAVVVDCRRKADAWMAEATRKPRSWLGAIVIVLIWIGTAVLLWWWLSHRADIAS